MRGGKGQTKIESFVEVLFSNVIGYVIDVVFVMVVAPMFDIKIDIGIITGGVAVLYGIHILKSFLYRRGWNWLLLRQHKAAKKNKLKRAANHGNITKLRD